MSAPGPAVAAAVRLLCLAVVGALLGCLCLPAPCSFTVAAAAPASAAAPLSRLLASDIVRDFPPSARSRRWLKALRTSSAHSSQPSSSSSPSPDTLFYPTDYGADAIGVNDSSPAFAALMADLLSPSRVNHTHRLANGIVDLGGATVDLQGGDYLLSQPLVLPFCYGNLRFVRGTLRAASSFPPSSYLVVLGQGSSAACKATGQDTTMENVAVSELMLDGSQVAAGGLRISDCMGAVLGPQVFYLGFTRAGLTISGGHEVQVLNSWLGQYTYSDPRKEKGKAMGIEVLGNDHVISDVVVFSAQTGIYVKGAANLFTNVHAWNCATGNHGVGIYLDCAGYTQNRLVGVYMDWTALVAVAPEHLVVVDSFFLGGGAIVLATSPTSRAINGLSISNNQWDDGGGVAAIQLNETAGAFTSLTDCDIDGNMLDSSYHAQSSRAHVRATVAHSLSSSNGTSTYCIDLSAQLLFSQFNLSAAQLSLSVDDPTSGLPSFAIVPGQADGLAAADRRSLCVAVDFSEVGRRRSTRGDGSGVLQLTFDISVDQSAYSFGRRRADSPALLQPMRSARGQ